MHSCFVCSNCGFIFSGADAFFKGFPFNRFERSGKLNQFDKWLCYGPALTVAAVIVHYADPSQTYCKGYRLNVRQTMHSHVMANRRNLAM